jgi:hypothetical protein
MQEEAIESGRVNASAFEDIVISEVTSDGVAENSENADSGRFGAEQERT